MSNGQFQFLAVSLLVVYLAAPIAALVLRRPWPVLLVNVAVAVVLIGHFALGATASTPSPTDREANVAAGEAAVIVLAAAGYWRVALTVTLSCIVFALHGLTSAFLAWFALTFQMTRLF